MSRVKSSRAICRSACSIRASQSSSSFSFCCFSAAGRASLLVKLNKIYTRTGDGGSAGLVDGSRISKSSARIAAIGERDEANSAICVGIGGVAEHDLGSRLRQVQNELFDLGADLAPPGEMEGALRIVPSQVERLEREIDTMNE